jgi:hypothetical protein
MGPDLLQELTFQSLVAEDDVDYEQILPRKWGVASGRRIGASESDGREITLHPRKWPVTTG